MKKIVLTILLVVVIGASLVGCAADPISDVDNHAPYDGYEAAYVLKYDGNYSFDEPASESLPENGIVYIYQLGSDIEVVVCKRSGQYVFSFDENDFPDMGTGNASYITRADFGFYSDCIDDCVRKMSLYDGELIVNKWYKVK